MSRGGHQTKLPIINFEVRPLTHQTHKSFNEKQTAVDTQQGGTQLEYIQRTLGATQGGGPAPAPSATDNLPRISSGYEGYFLEDDAPYARGPEAPS